MAKSLRDLKKSIESNPKLLEQAMEIINAAIEYEGVATEYKQRSNELIGVKQQLKDEKKKISGATLILAEKNKAKEELDKYLDGGYKENEANKERELNERMAKREAAQIAILKEARVQLEVDEAEHGKWTNRINKARKTLKDMKEGLPV